jgi:coenzyme F420-0:L-glutamate ligase/coenzyme F420-1:gamma-L-glutamate ligase
VLPARVDASSFGTGAVSAASVSRAVRAADFAAAPGVSLDLEFLVVDAGAASATAVASSGLSVLDFFGPVAASAPMLIVPWLRRPASSSRAPSPRELLAAGAAIENVLVALAIEQLASCWVLPELHVPVETFGLGSDAWPIGVIAVGPIPGSER